VSVNNQLKYPLKELRNIHLSGLSTTTHHSNTNICIDLVSIIKINHHSNKFSPNDTLMQVIQNYVHLISPQ